MGMWDQLSSYDIPWCDGVSKGIHNPREPNQGHLPHSGKLEAASDGGDLKTHTYLCCTSYLYYRYTIPSHV